MKTLADEPGTLTAPSKALQLICRGVARFPLTPSFRHYNLSISREKKIIWFRVAKAGSRTLFHELRENGVKLDAEHAMSVYYAPRLYRDYFKFAFVRNPWDRLVSCWNNKVLDENYFQFSEPVREKMRVFENFVAYVASLDVERCDQHLRLQCRLIDLNHIDFLGRLESFGTDLHALFELLQLDVTGSAVRNASRNRKPYRQYYSDELAETVGRLYRRDVQVFRYDF